MSEPIFYYYLHYWRITLKLGHFLITMWLLGILAGVLRGKIFPLNASLRSLLPLIKRQSNRPRQTLGITSYFSAARPPAFWLCYTLAKGKLIFSPKRGFPARIPRSLVEKYLRRNCPNVRIACLTDIFYDTII